MALSKDHHGGNVAPTHADSAFIGGRAEDLLGACRADAVRGFASGFLCEMFLERKPLAVVFDFAAPSTDMEKTFQITEARNNSINFIG